MIVLMVFGGWAGVVLAGCLRAEILRNRAAAVREEFQDNRIARLLSDTQQAEINCAALLGYVDREPAEVIGFDKLVRILPKVSVDGQPFRYVEMLDREQFVSLAHRFVSRPITNEDWIPELQFNPIRRVGRSGYPYTGWERNGWTLLPSEALRK